MKMADEIFLNIPQNHTEVCPDSNLNHAILVAANWNSTSHCVYPARGLYLAKGESTYDNVQQLIQRVCSRCKSEEPANPIDGSLWTDRAVSIPHAFALQDRFP